MGSMNKVILIGNLGKDPEVRHLEGGVAVARFPMATSETYKDKQGARQEKTEWHNVVLWRGIAEVAEKYLKKGMSVAIEGKLQTNKYTDKDGVERYSTEIVASGMTMLGTAGGGTSSDGEQAAAGGKAFANDEPDDLPF